MSANHLMSNYGHPSRAITRGEGVYLYDDSGKKYLDMTAGIAVCNLGHAHPAVTAALTDQATRLVHCSNLFRIPIQEEVAEKLVRLSGLDKAFFCNSGAEANEAALKFARKYGASKSPSKTKILSLPRAFHGRTMGALSLTPKPQYHEGFTPLLAECYTPPTLESVLEEIDDDVAAVFVEIVQGEGGLLPVPHDFLQALAARLKDVQGLLVVDEVQTGVGRSGSFFAYEQVPIQPDMVTMAKGLGNGFPVGAVVVKDVVADVLGPGTHGSTFGGNPLAMSVANVVIDHVADKAFLEHVCRMGRVMQQMLERHVSGLTGMGLMYGFDSEDAAEFTRQAASHGVLCTTAGPTRVRFVPPLVLQECHIAELEERLFMQN